MNTKELCEQVEKLQRELQWRIRQRQQHIDALMTPPTMYAPAPFTDRALAMEITAQGELEEIDAIVTKIIADCHAQGCEDGASL